MAGTPTWFYQVERADDGSLVMLTGELDMAASSQLSDMLTTELTRPAARRVTADLGGVTFLDSTALSSLLAAHTTAHDCGKTFSVTNPTRTVRRVLDITGLYQLLTTE